MKAVRVSLGQGAAELELTSEKEGSLSEPPALLVMKSNLPGCPVDQNVSKTRELHRACSTQYLSIVLVQ